MRKAKLLALGLGFWCSAALAQNVTNHAVPVGRGTGVSGWGIAGPCNAGQTLIWSNNTSDPACGSAAATSLIIGSSGITGGQSNGVLFNNGGLLGNTTPLSNAVFVGNGTGVPLMSTTLPPVTLLSPIILATNQLSALNAIPLSSLLKIPTKAVLGNASASAGNVSTPWTVSNLVDTVISLVHGAVVSSNAACWNDTAGTLKDCGTALGTAAAANTGPGGHNLPFLDIANVWTGAQIWNASVNFTSTFQIGSQTITWPSGALTVLAANLSSQTVSGGANLTAYTQAAGNFTVDCSHNPAQYVVANTIAWNIVAPSNDGECILQVEIGTTGFVPNFSGFSQGSNVGDTMAVPGSGTNYYQISVVTIHSKSHYLVTALQ